MLVDVTKVLMDNWELATVLVGVMWLAALSPMALLGIAIAAVILLFKGLYDLFSGDDDWLLTAFDDAIVFWMEVLGEFFDWLGNQITDAISRITGIGKTTTERAQETADFKSNLFYRQIEKPGREREAELDAWESANDARFEALRARQGFEGLGATISPSPIGAGQGPLMGDVNVTIEAGANVTDEQIERIGEVTSESMERESRKLRTGK